MVLGGADNRNVPAIFLHYLTFGHSLGRIVGALGVDLGTQFAQERAHVWFGKYHDRIDGFERGNDLSAFCSRHARASFSFQVANRGVVVDGNHYTPTQRLGPAQITDMADMQHVETAVRQDDALPGAPPFCNPRAQGAAVEHLVPGRHWHLFYHEESGHRVIGGLNYPAACSLRNAFINSSRVREAVPRFITTMPHP